MIGNTHQNLIFCPTLLNVSPASSDPSRSLPNAGPEAPRSHSEQEHAIQSFPVLPSHFCSSHAPSLSKASWQDWLTSRHPKGEKHMFFSCPWFWPMFLWTHDFLHGNWAGMVAKLSRIYLEEGLVLGMTSKDACWVLKLDDFETFLNS